MPVKNIGVIEKTYKQIDIDNAMKEGYKIAEKQYSENIIKLKEEIKQLKFSNKIVSLESATQNNKEDYRRDEVNEKKHLNTKEIKI